MKTQKSFQMIYLRYVPSSTRIANIFEHKTFYKPARKVYQIMNISLAFLYHPIPLL